MARTISQREFRNASAAVMDAVEAGETVIVTRNGVAVAEVRPLQRRAFAATADLLRSFRELPPLNHDALRADADAAFGADALDD